MSSAKKTRTGWRARYRTPEGDSRSRNFPTKKEADDFLTTVDHSKLTGGFVDPSAGKLTFGEFAEQWRLMQVHRPSTRAQVEINLKKHAYPILGHRPLHSVRPSEIQAWVKGRSEVLAASTVETLFRHVSAIFKAAVADRLITSSPCAGTKLPKPPKAQVVPLAPEAVERQIEAVPARYRALILLAAGTGLRQGECFGLTVDRIDFLRRTLRVDRQLVLVGPEPEFGPPKTEASYRTIPLPPVVVEALAAHLAAFEPGPDGLLFTNERGEPIRRNRFNDSVWKPAARTAELPEWATFHDLRHFYASLLIRHGESVKVVQARLGHASASETLDTYSHLWPDSEDRTREAVESVLRPLVSPACHDEAERL